MSALDQLIAIRKNIHNTVSDIPERAWFTIPSGFDNNIAWNIGHMITVQQRLHYVRVGATPYVSDDFMNMYIPGTSPADWGADPNIGQLLSHLIELPSKFAVDYQTLSQREFPSSTTKSGIVLDSLEAATTFNNYHDGQHLGFIHALINLTVL